MTDLVLEARGLTKIYGGGRSWRGAPLPRAYAVRDVAIGLERGRTLGIVGESGCGKSTLARMLASLVTPTAGTIHLNGATAAPRGRLSQTKKRPVQYVFQDPIGALNPRKTIRAILATPLVRLARLDRDRTRERLGELMDAVQLRPDALDRYPHEFSGGQAQRIGIARALAANPDIIIFDEPLSALDVSVQAQVLNLLAEVKQRFHLSCIFISHNLAVTEIISDHVAVMYFGRIVEQGPARQLFAHPRHPYTRLLLDSAPVIGRKSKRAGVETAELPNPYDPPDGCAFAARCPNAKERCRIGPAPALQEMAVQHDAACFYPLP